MNTVQREEILKIMLNLELANEGLIETKQCYKRDEAAKLVEQAHIAVSKLLIES